VTEESTLEYHEFDDFIHQTVCIVSDLLRTEWLTTTRGGSRKPMSIAEGVLGSCEYFLLMLR
jgi:hypothetical protein